ncbi:hypothetical protein G5B39_02215 [Rhodobacteraceae bacterium SC52]|nr:hypothetical protein G5B39_02215 [Rhodobacteraceae bacterium SC52]
MKSWVIILGSIALVTIGAGSWLLSRGGLSIEQITNPGKQVAAPATDADIEVIRTRLLEVGLHPTGVLSDLGVDDHLGRLAAGHVDAATLLGYADAIDDLSTRSTLRGQSLPPPLWDVSTPALLEAGWTVYSLTEALASEASAIHINLLSDAYGAFLATRPDALEGALALLPLAGSYVRFLPEAARAEHAVHAKTDGEATILIWQALLSGTSRNNPLTHRPLFSHGFVGHFSVPHIHQYATGEGLTPSQVWGVEGFDPTFVGPPTNDNHVEHMGLSALLQGVANVPGAVLYAVEALEIAVDHEDASAAAADRALNRAVRDVLLPNMGKDPRELMRALLATLG